MYYIICKRHMHRKDYAILFWGKDRQGYTYDVNMAGVYTEKDTGSFCAHHRDDKPIPVATVEALVIPSVIDRSRLGRICRNTLANREVLGIKMSELLNSSTAWDEGAFCSPDAFVNKNLNTVKILEEIKTMKLTAKINAARKKTGAA